MKVTTSRGKFNSDRPLNYFALTLKPEENSSTPFFDKPVHHVHMMDRSGSMYSSSDTLVADVKRTVEACKNGDYLTVLWFSSANEYRVLLKGVQITDMNHENIYKMLDNISGGFHQTCFSSPLSEVNQILDEIDPMCDLHNITLFTDGRPVTPWSYSDEVALIKSELKAMTESRKDHIVINTIGYTHYYDEELLESMARTTSQGVHTHSSRIEEYLEIFKSNYEQIQDLTGHTVHIETKCSDLDVVCCRRSSVSVPLDKNSFDLMLSMPSDKIIFVTPDDNIVVTVDGVEYDFAQAQIRKSSDLTVYSYAYGMMLAGDRQKALTIVVKALRDRDLADLMINSFTMDEVAKVLKTMKRCLTNSKSRHTNTCDSDYLPNENSPCLVELLSIILSDEESMYQPPENYKHAVRTVHDNYNLFKSTGSRQDFYKISEMTTDKEKLNIGIRFRVDGKVELNPASAKRVGLDREIDAHIFRVNLLICDGYPYQDVATFKVTTNTLNELLAYYPSLSYSEAEDSRYIIKVTMADLPVINRKYFNATNLESILAKRLEMLDKECQYKLLGYFRDELDSSFSSPNEESKNKLPKYTEEQSLVLKECGIDRTGCYRGLNESKSVDHVEDCDFYEARRISFEIKGVSSLPKVQDVLDRESEGKKQTTAGSYIKKALDDLKESNIDLTSYSELSDARHTISKELTKARAELASIRIAIGLTGCWFSELVPDEKKPGQYSYTNDNLGATLIAKTDVIKVYTDKAD